MTDLIEGIDVPDVLITDRLELCTLTYDMAEEIYEATKASKKEFEPWFNWSVNTSLEYTEEHVEMSVEEQLDGEAFHFCIYLKGTDTFIGRVSLDRGKPELPFFNIGYWLSSAYTGKGYMTEAVMEVVDLAINVLKCRRLGMFCDVENIASQNIIEKLTESFGFKKLCTHENFERRLLDGSLRDFTEYTFTQGDE